eukprot:14584046-Alexandrium_andersonii.AAC.1
MPADRTVGRLLENLQSQHPDDAPRALCEAIVRARRLRGSRIIEDEEETQIRQIAARGKYVSQDIQHCHVTGM